ncbi:alpha/beta fold hydrolase [Nonomuraea phyllanthi]|uniref:Alpha/beta fold hydrolase n=1 Tax=Nonomuraea phyllanthi TaxID=2219224 RepID=A0A5C4UUY8_9ACTN|nr:alpha/beta fold hydrolase [Nonomuraea phyllanthi]
MTHLPTKGTIVLHRILLAATAAGLLAGSVTATPAGADASTPAARCRDVTVPVSIAAGQPRSHRIWGQLCTPAGRAASTVQVLIHGLNYSHVYWDFPYRTHHYSYVKRANQAGYATFNLDRIGVGRSSHPASKEVTLQSNALTIAQVAQALRTGKAGPRAFAEVVLVGHSFGSEVAKFAASRFQAADALILTGNAHRVSPSGAELAGRYGQPVSEVPRLAAQVPPGDDGYVTVKDEQRPAVMYYVPGADPQVIARDSATKETNTMSELFSLGDAGAPGVTEAIRVPVLFVVGKRDRLVCAADANDCTSPAALAADERPLYPAAPRVDAVVLDDVGHAINLHRRAPAAYTKVLNWLDRSI